jgi:hypothetical protein
MTLLKSSSLSCYTNKIAMFQCMENTCCIYMLHNPHFISKQLWNKHKWECCILMFQATNAWWDEWCSCLWNKMQFVGAKHLGCYKSPDPCSVSSERGRFPCAPRGRRNEPSPSAPKACPMVEPPKLYGPYTPVIVPKTSDGYACVPDNLKSLSGVLEKPESSMIFRAGSHYRGITVLQ